MIAHVVTKSASSNNATAAFEQVLFYHEAPEVVLLDLGKVSKVIAVATDKISSRSFFGAKISNAQWRNYLQERFDLRYLILRPDRWTWYEFDLPAKETDRVQLDNVELTRDRIDRLVPSHGFFARDHSEEYDAITFASRSVQRFDVDGQWDMREFGKFHAQISDLYAFSQSVEQYSDKATSVEHKRQIMESFVKPWQGGGSYYGFFKSLAKAGGDDARPDIKAIQWASPGYMDVVGDADAFDKLISLVDHFGRNRRGIIESYDHLWSYLKDTGFLKNSSKGIRRDSPILTEIGLRASELGKVLGATSYTVLKQMAGDDNVVAAKVLLATERRVSRLYDFFSEGRVAVSGVEIS